MCVWTKGVLPKMLGQLGINEPPGGPKSSGAGTGAGTGATLRGGLLGSGARTVDWGAEPGPDVGLDPTLTA